MEYNFEFTRGDTFVFNFQLVDADGNVIVLTPTTSEVIFTVKPDYAPENVVLQKKYSTGEIQFADNYVVVEIMPTDTNDLLYGTYVYDVEFTSGDYVKTVLKGNIVLTKEVTTAQDK